MAMTKSLVGAVHRALLGRGLTYLAQRNLRNALQGDSAECQLLFRALIDSILHFYHGYGAQQAADAWARFRFTTADFVYFAEAQLFARGHLAFLTGLCLRDVRALDQLSPRALAAALLFVLLEQGELARPGAAGAAEGRAPPPGQPAQPPQRAPTVLLLQHRHLAQRE